MRWIALSIAAVLAFAGVSHGGNFASDLIDLHNDWRAELDLADIARDGRLDTAAKKIAADYSRGRPQQGLTHVRNAGYTGLVHMVFYESGRRPKAAGVFNSLVADPGSYYRAAVELPEHKHIGMAIGKRRGVVILFLIYGHGDE